MYIRNLQFGSGGARPKLIENELRFSEDKDLTTQKCLQAICSDFSVSIPGFILYATHLYGHGRLVYTWDSTTGCGKYNAAVSTG